MLWRRPCLPCRQHCRGLRQHTAFSGRSSTILRSNSLRMPYVHADRRAYGDISRHSNLSKSGMTTADGSVVVAGLVRSIRKQKKLAFLHISDGSTLAPIQAILSPSQADGITNGSYVQLSGQWVSSSGKGQAYELQVETVKDIGTTVPEEFPIQKKAQTPDFLRTIPHLRFRTPLYSLLARVRSTLISGVYSYYASLQDSETYIQVQPPLITSSDCEGAGEVFTITPKPQVPMATKNIDQRQELYFRDPKYLTVSSQLHLEAYSAELGNVWALSPTFRAEESETPRHLAEFYMLEAEIRSINSLEELMRETERLIKYVVRDLMDSRCGHDLLSYSTDPKLHGVDDSAKLDLASRWNCLLRQSWMTMTYADAIDQLMKYHVEHPATFSHPPNYDTGLQLEHERWLVAHIASGEPLFVTHFPKQIKPFYMLPSELSSDERTYSGGQGQTVACFDLLFPHGTAELVGGSLREHRLEYLISSMREKGLIRSIAEDHVKVDEGIHATTTTSPAATTTTKLEASYPFLQPGETLGTMQWYTDLRRFGSAPHGGFGLGFDRLVAYLTGVASIRDTVGFPRYFGRADC